MLLRKLIINVLTTKKRWSLCDGTKVLREHCGSNYFAIYEGIKSTRCTPKTYTVLYANFISIKLEKIKEKAADFFKK